MQIARNIISDDTLTEPQTPKHIFQSNKKITKTKGKTSRRCKISIWACKGMLLTRESMLTYKEYCHFLLRASFPSSGLPHLLVGSAFLSTKCRIHKKEFQNLKLKKVRDRMKV